MMTMIFAALAVVATHLQANPSDQTLPGPHSLELRKHGPRSDPNAWITRADFPSQLDNADISRTAKYHLVISPTGVPTRCEVQISSGHALLDETACRTLMARARFYPAYNARGEDIEGGYWRYVDWSKFGGIRFGLPTGPISQSLPPRPNFSRAVAPIGDTRNWITFGDYPPEAKALRLEGMTSVSLAVDEQGVPRSCEIRGSSGSSLLDRTTCALLMARARFTPARRPDGQPTRSIFNRLVKWTLD